MPGKTAYSADIPGLVHADLTDEEYESHLAVGWKSSAEGDEQVASEAQQVQSPTGTPSDQTPGSQPTAAEKPGGNASLEEWQTFARTMGATDADLDGRTRNDLRDTYGS